MLLVRLLCQFLIADWRLAPVVNVTPVRLPYLLTVLLDELGRCHAHLLLHWKTLARGALVVLGRVRVEILQHERRLLEFLQFVFVV